MSRKFKWLILHVSYIWVIIMSMRLLEKARRRESCSSKLLWAFFLWIYSIGFTLRLIEANLIVTGSRDGHMIVTGCHGDRDTCGHFLALHDLNVVCSTGSFYPFFIISCNNIDIGVWPGCELKGGRWDSKKKFQQHVMVPVTIWKIFCRWPYSSNFKKTYHSKCVIVRLYFEFLL